MIVRRWLPILIVGLLLPVYFLALSTAAGERKKLLQVRAVSYVLPPQLLKITTLEFDSLAADFLFLKGLTFYGETMNRTERPRVTEDEWRWLYAVLDAATDLDPWFYDPYYFANTNFTWDAGKAREANTLLAKGNKARTWDWTIPFFMGFNEYYFLHDHAKAAEYLMEGSRRPDADPIVAGLAVRMAYKGSGTEIAIAFLQATLKTLGDSPEKYVMEARLKVFKEIQALEQVIAVYTRYHGSPPASLQELVRKGIIKQIPVDPYGGKLYIDSDGNIRSTIR
jgi:hypothetical protein